MDTSEYTDTPDPVEQELDAWAHSKGYASHLEMVQALESGTVRMSKEEREAALQDLKPMADQAALAAANAQVDATGLPVHPDYIASFVRLIRVLLFGYTEEEQAFREDRFIGLMMLDQAHQNTMKARERFLAGLEQRQANDAVFVPVSSRSMRP